MLAYIRLVINPRDDEAFKRIVNYPARGIGDTTVQRIAELAAGRGVSMWEAVDTLVAEPAADPVQKTIARKVSDFVAMIRGLSLARNEKSLYDFGLEIATRSGIIAAYRTENTPEATSALDNESEYEVAKSLEKLSKGRTTITIAHRLSSIRNSDRILVLTQEGIAEEGNHEALMEKKGIYYQFYTMADRLK